MIDLSQVKDTLKDVDALIGDLDGRELDETDAITSQAKAKPREIKSQRSKDLLLLAHRLKLASELVTNEYWFARGEPDPLDADRFL